MKAAVGNCAEGGKLTKKKEKDFLPTCKRFWRSKDVEGRERRDLGVPLPNLKRGRQPRLPKEPSLCKGVTWAAQAGSNPRNQVSQPSLKKTF